MEDFRVRKAADIIGSIVGPDVAAMAGSWSRMPGMWQQAAGDVLAAHSRPVDVRNGILVVEADHPGWIQLLQIEQQRIMDTVKRRLPELAIRGIAFRTPKDQSIPGTIPARTFQIDEQRPAEMADNADDDLVAGVGSETNPEPDLQTTLDAVEDSEFRDILASLAATIRKRG
jgi:hypothetical protein